MTIHKVRNRVVAVKEKETKTGLRNESADVPSDVVALCEQIAKGHERRLAEYKAKRLDILYYSGCGGDNIGGTRSTDISDTTAKKAQRLEELEQSLDARFVEAVEQAIVSVGFGKNEEFRARLRKAIILNCVNGKEHPYQYLNIDEISRAEFYRHRKGFFRRIAKELGLI